MKQPPPPPPLLDFVTVMITVSAAEANPWLSVTVRENTNVVVFSTDGAVNVGFAAEAPDKVTGIPVASVWVHAYPATVPSGSVEPVPSRTTDAPDLTD